jgi:hypothetical protein
MSINKSNINKNNITPFLNYILNTHSQLITNLPFIPAFYFFPNGLGENIIDDYNDVKKKMNDLEIIKKMILLILKTSKENFENIELSSKKYQFKIDNSIKEVFKESFFSQEIFKENYNETFKKNETFIDFKNTFIKNNFSIFKDTLFKTPYFFNIFQNEYSGKSKNFFLSLFKRYNRTRISLLDKYLEKNYGILGLNFLFDVYNHLKINNSKKKNVSVNNNNNYIFNNGEYINYNNNNIKYTSIPHKNAVKPSLKKKINKFNQLYVEYYDANYYITNLVENLNEIYSKFIDAKNNLLEISNSYNFYDTIVNLIEVDFYLIKFMFHYVNYYIFKNVIESHLKIKLYIYRKINIFDMYYSDYIDWYNKMDGFTESNNKSLEFDKNFKTFFDEMFKLLIS